MSDLDRHTRSLWLSSERFWMLLCIVIFVSTVISWIPALELPLGDDHQGRILGRMALHADNFLARGWSGSNYIADWRPYSSVPYAHHPPLQQFMHAGFAWLTGGASALGVRTVELAGGVLTAGLLTGFVRKLSGSWVPAAFAMGGLAVSGFFWLFGRSWGLLFVVTFFLIHLIDSRKTTGGARALVFAIAVFTTLHSWQGSLTIGLLAIMDFLGASRRRALITFAGLAAGFSLDLLWIESAAGLGALAGHLQERIAAADYGALDWLARQLGFLTRFESVPTVLLAVVGVIVGLKYAKYRPYMAASFLAVMMFAVVFYQNAWVHEYWNWRGALVLALGMGSLGTWFVSVRRPDWARWGVAALAVVTAAVPLLRLSGDLYAAQYTESSAAGALAERTEWPESQPIVWHYGGLSGPRWLSWYSNLPVRQVDLDDPPDPFTFVFVKRSSGDGLEEVETMDSLGRYVVIQSDELVDRLGSSP